MPTADNVSALLHALALRARDERGKGLSDAVGVVGDLGRVVAAGAPADVRSLQAAVAGLREQLDSDEVNNQPAKALDGRNSHTYLAGAMWAINEIMNSQLDTVEARSDVERAGTRRFQSEKLVLEVLRGGGALSPRDISQAVEEAGQEIRSDEISRALSLLIGKGLVAAVPADWPGADRRRRYFRVIDKANDADAVAGSQGN